MCIKVLGSSYKKYARIGDTIVVSIKKRKGTVKFLQKTHISKRYIVGTIHRVLVIRTKAKFSRSKTVFIKFTDNSGIIVNKRGAPVSNRIKGPVLFELALKTPSIGLLSQYIL
jgi:large subunit ribosomal protein L14